MWCSKVYGDRKNKRRLLFFSQMCCEIKLFLKKEKNILNWAYWHIRVILTAQDEIGKL